MQPTLQRHHLCGFPVPGLYLWSTAWLDSSGFSGQRKKLWAGWVQARPQLTLMPCPTSYKYCFLLSMLWEELSCKKQQSLGLLSSPALLISRSNCWEICNTTLWPKPGKWIVLLQALSSQHRTEVIHPFWCCCLMAPFPKKSRSFWRGRGGWRSQAGGGYSEH